MDRTTVRGGIALAFLLYGLYAASFVPGLVVAPSVPILLIGALAKAALACAAAFGVWTGRPWAPAAIVLAGVVIAALWLIEAFVLGIVAYLYALGAAVLAIVVTFAAAAYLFDRHPGAASLRRLH
jgi:hypothetical protein